MAGSRGLACCRVCSVGVVERFRVGGWPGKGDASLAFGIGHAEGKTKVLVVVLRSDVLGAALLVVWGFVRIGLDGGSYQTTDQNNLASTTVQLVVSSQQIPFMTEPFWKRQSFRTVATVSVSCKDKSMSLH